MFSHPLISTGFHTHLNKEDFCKLYNNTQISRLTQIHSNRVHYVSKASFFEIEGDAQWTDIPGLRLAVGHADCIPVLFYASEPKLIVGTIHAGRRGVAGNIVGNTLEQLKNNNIDVSSLHVGIGPSICQHCFEFGADGSNPYEYFGKEYILENSQGTRNIDTRAMLHSQLIENGVHPSNIIEDDRCTVESHELSSWRRDQIKGMNNYCEISISQLSCM